MAPHSMKRMREPLSRMIAGAVLVVLLPLLAPSGPATASEGIQPVADAEFFRSLIEREGPAKVRARLYNESSDFLMALLAGVASGAREWLGIYDRLRPEADPSTAARLDDAIARSLSRSPDSALAHLRSHGKQRVAEVCRRTGHELNEPSGVLDPAAFFDLLRRQQKLMEKGSAASDSERAACLAETRSLVRRQWRVYLVSYGFHGPESSASGELSTEQAQELAKAALDARKDRTLVARRDGTFPDGPFRVEEIPPEALRYCARGDVRTANPGERWEGTDGIQDRRLPFVRLLSACQVAADEWDITCERGGFAPIFRHVRVAKKDGSWAVLREETVFPPAVSTHGGWTDLWPECRSLSRLSR